MKEIILIPLTAILFTLSCFSQTTGTFTDFRDGKTYKTIKVDDRWIMAENFAYKPEQGNYWPYDNDSNNVTKYGYLYDWETAKNIAPKGWHLPTKLELKALKKSLGGKRDVFKYLGGTMEKVYKQMIEGGASGFNALLAGVRTADGRFMHLGNHTYFWSSSKSIDGQWFYSLNGKTDGKRSSILDSKEGIATLSSRQDRAKCGFSVRLFKDRIK